MGVGQGSSVLFLLLFHVIVGRSGCTLDQIVHVVVSVSLLLTSDTAIHVACFLLGLDTIGHLLVVTLGRLTVLGRRNSLALVSVVEFVALYKQ